MNGQVLKVLRNRHQVTQREMAAVLGVSPNCIAGYERANSVTVDRLAKYCDALSDVQLNDALINLDECLPIE